MDVGPLQNYIPPPQHVTSAVGDGDVGQKGSYYRRQQREKKQTTAEESPQARSTGEGSQHRIDIRV